MGQKCFSQKKIESKKDLDPEKKLSKNLVSKIIVSAKKFAKKLNQIFCPKKNWSTKNNYIGWLKEIWSKKT